MTDATPHMRCIGVYLYDWSDALDVVGPFEVLSAWVGFAQEEADARGLPAQEVPRLFTVADRAGPITVGGLPIIADRTWETAPRPDLLIVPGGCTVMMEDLVDAPERLRRLAESGTIIASVCTGTKLLADAGLLDGRSATTHWGYVDELAERRPAVTVDDSARFIDHGDVITSAGVSAGIDMALHLVQRFAGDDMARRVRRQIQYDPMPPV